MRSNWLSRAVPAIVICITFSAGAFAEEKFQKLNGQQIRAKFVGMEVTDESHWGDIFEPNGTLRTSSMGHKEPGSGCYEVWLSGKKVELRDQTAGFPLEGVLQKPTD
jgi:hypothetical protein